MQLYKLRVAPGTGTHRQQTGGGGCKGPGVVHKSIYCDIQVDQMYMNVKYWDWNKRTIHNNENINNLYYKLLESLFCSLNIWLSCIIGHPVVQNCALFPTENLKV